MHAIIILLILICSSVFTLQDANAGSCSPFKKIEEAGLYENEKFWADFAKLSSKGQPSDDQVMALIKKYNSETTSLSARNISTPTSIPTASAVGKQPIQLHHKAEKSLKKVPPQIRKKFDVFVALVKEKGVNGAIQELKGHNWNYEYLKQEGFHSIRLNDGYRAAFDIKDNKVFVRNVGQHIYAH